MAGSDVMVRWRLVFDNRLHVCGRSEIFQNSDRVCSKKEMCETWHSHLQSTALLHMYTLARTVVPLLEAPLELLLWHGCDSCCHILLKFFCGWRMMSLDHCVHCQEEPGIAQSKIWSIWWWWGGFKSVNWFRILILNWSLPVANFDYIFIVPWCCWPAVVLIFYWFFPIFKVDFGRVSSLSVTGDLTRVSIADICILQTDLDGHALFRLGHCNKH
jgi:hypothetical protein